jgi:acetyl-CoA carboxylase biotin carboxylase subunit
MFKKILVANRSEIANRIFLACRELGIRSVAVYSDVDQDAPWAQMADESYALPGVTATETYLNQSAILTIAQKCGADAIHPGYGFLSENPEFAAACADHGIVFIGPSPEAMRIMGSKTAARVLAQSAGVPVVPGADGADKSDNELMTTAAAIGYPILIKASAGGGGRGMRVVWSEDEFEGAIQSARSEALSAFGSDHVLLEKFFTEVHHVEIQVFGDSHGNILHLYERECSIQRRHQKIIEESPAPIMASHAWGGKLTREMAESAVSLARAANYVNAGTVEFVVDVSQRDKGCFYFLEMNTRLQVEHPITELVTGIDLAVWQIRIAAGKPLPLKQAAIQQRGHAIECRIYAENPENQFLPSVGEIGVYRPPSGPGVRVDDGIMTGSRVSPYYDSMLAKVITWGHDRPEAIRKMVRALRDTVVLGVTTNIPFLIDILHETAFLQGHTDTSYLQEHMAHWTSDREASDIDWLALGVMELMKGGAKDNGRRSRDDGTSASQPDPWKDSSHWRNVH